MEEDGRGEESKRCKLQLLEKGIHCMQMMRISYSDGREGLLCSGEVFRFPGE